VKDIFPVSQGGRRVTFVAINTLQIAWLSRLACKGIISKGQSILEFSPQDVASSPREVRHYALRHNPPGVVDDVLGEIFDGDVARKGASAPFYRIFGVERYRSTDAIDYRADWMRDFNSPVGLRERFDLVTNFGTAEHVFNIGEMFRSMHDVLRPGGVALHVMPAFGEIDHGFYNIHPTTYLDLAAANDYVIEDMHYVDRWDIRNKILEAEFPAEFDFDNLPIHLEHLKDRPFLQRKVTDLFVENYRDSETQRYGGDRPGLLYDYCCVALRKTKPDRFRVPLQGVYGGGVAEDTVTWRRRLLTFSVMRFGPVIPLVPRPIRKFIGKILRASGSPEK
jgi:SAM-dependent methyltransferase